MKVVIIVILQKVSELLNSNICYINIRLKKILYFSIKYFFIILVNIYIILLYLYIF